MCCKGNRQTISSAGGYVDIGTGELQNPKRIRYIGRACAAVTFFARETKKPYVFGTDRPEGEVDERDVYFFLSRREKGDKPMFELVVDAPAPAVIPALPETDTLVPPVIPEPNELAVLLEISGVKQAMVDKLIKAGYSLAKLAQADPAELKKLSTKANDIIEFAKSKVQ